MAPAADSVVVLVVVVVLPAAAVPELQVKEILAALVVHRHAPLVVVVVEQEGQDLLPQLPPQRLPLVVVDLGV